MGAGARLISWLCLQVSLLIGESRTDAGGGETCPQNRKDDEMSEMFVTVEEMLRNRVAALEAQLSKITLAIARITAENANLTIELEDSTRWTPVSEYPFPDRDGVIVCWDEQKLTAFYFSTEWTTMLPYGTVKWFLVPNPEAA